MVENGDNSRPALVEKRYSDFLNLLTRLQENYPSLMKNLPFPKKVLLGNYTSSLIKRRSRHFEHFLTYLYSKDVLKCSSHFANFMHHREIQESSQYLLHSEYEHAIPILENMYCLLCCLDSDKNLLLKVHLQLIVCLHAVARHEPAYDYSLEALRRFRSRNTEGNHLAKDMYLPFLSFCRRLWWVLGKDRTSIETALRKETDLIDNIPELLEVLRDKINLHSPCS